MYKVCMCRCVSGMFMPYQRESHWACSGTICTASLSSPILSTLMPGLLLKTITTNHLHLHLEHADALR